GPATLQSFQLKLSCSSFFTVSQSDCYVSLWLPTATSEKVRTKTINNCKDPVWNETFYYRIQNQVKNLLELEVYDEDSVSSDDHLFTLCFDISRIPMGGPVAVVLKPDPQAQEELDVEFLLEPAVERFAHWKRWSIRAGHIGHFPCCRSTKAGVPAVMLNKLPMGEKVPIVENRKYNLNVQVDDCQCSCPGDLDVRLGYGLCPQEQEFLFKRKRRVAWALKQALGLNYDLQDHEIPVVAVMTTGGGTRSFTTGYGTLRGLQKLGLLDCVTYLSGLSGTSWTMAHLYRDALWSQKSLDEQIEDAKKQVTKSKMGIFSVDRVRYYKQQLNQRRQEGHKTTFIDLWGLIIEYLLNDGKDNSKLSEQRAALVEGQNPLPIYVTLNVKDKHSTEDFKEWVEFTPYEVGFLKYGTFVQPENFGSKFFMGRVVEKIPESRIIYLHGMWSSIFSLNLVYIWNRINNSEEFWHRWTRDKIVDLDEDPTLPTRPYELRSHMFVPAGNLSKALRGVLTDRLSVAQCHNFLNGLQLHNNYLEHEGFKRWKATVLDDRPNQLTEHDQYMGLVDAGFFINTSCPALSRPERKVDIILHMSYNAGSQSLPLERTSKYYAEQNIPFPNIYLSEEEKKNLKECYFFDQNGTPGCPMVVFFPLVCNTFRHYKAPGVKRCEAEIPAGDVDISSCFTPYSTYCLTYSEENFDKLLNLSEYNILNNQHVLMHALRTAIQRKRQCCCMN
ncbi:hypothetical protein lerEdw1_017251, partial [Lerista edwardsae]